MVPNKVYEIGKHSVGLQISREESKLIVNIIQSCHHHGDNIGHHTSNIDAK